MTNIEKKIEEIVKEPINNLGYRLYDVIYTKEGKDNYLKIFIDNNIGISLDDCEKVNNSIESMLDEVNIIKEKYFLEISSPGIERNIRKEEHFKENIDKEICIKLLKKEAEINSKIVIGILKNFNNDYIEIKLEQKNIKIDRKNIAIIHTMYKW